MRSRWALERAVNFRKLGAGGVGRLTLLGEGLQLILIGGSLG